MFKFFKKKDKELPVEEWHVCKKDKKEESDNWYTIEGNTITIPEIEIFDMIITLSTVFKDIQIVNDDTIKITVEEKTNTMYINDIVPQYSYSNCFNMFLGTSMSDSAYIESKKDKLCVKYLVTYTIRMIFRRPRMQYYNIDKDSIQVLKTIKVEDVFKEYENGYKLIETLEEFHDYMSKDYTVDDWCRIKVLNKFNELGILKTCRQELLALIGTDNLEKYHELLKAAETIPSYNLGYFMIDKLKEKRRH